MATGGELICAAMERCGATHVFGLPGTQTIGFYDALRRSRLRSVVSTHELAAAFMANGFYRASGRIAVVSTIGGPGLTYAMTGLAEASQDSAGLVCITGRVCRKPPRPFDLQDLDQRKMLAPVVKKVISVERGGQIDAAVREAFWHAANGEPGPVVVEVDNHLLAPAQVEANDAEPIEPEEPATPEPPDLVARIASLLLESKRPMLFFGQGAAGSAVEALRLAERLGAPVVTTRSGRGIVPESHPLSYVFDYSDQGLAALNDLIDRSDLVLAVGCKLSHNGTYGFRLRLPKDRLIHCDASPRALNANYPAQLAVCVDAAVLMRGLDGWDQQFAARASGWDPAVLARCRERAGNRAGLEPVVQGQDTASPADFFRSLREAMPPESCLVTDSGHHQVMTTRHFRVERPRGLLIPSDFQSMGFGLPAAIGAKLGNPDRPVAALIGDGGLAMTGMELGTAVRERIPLTVIVFNDGALGQIRLQQISSFGVPHSTSLATPDLSTLAKAFGAEYYAADRDLGRHLPPMLVSGAVTVVEVVLTDGLQIHYESLKGSIRGAGRRVVQSVVPNLRKVPFLGKRSKLNRQFS